MSITKYSLLNEVSSTGIELDENKKYRNIDLMKLLGQYYFTYHLKHSKNLELIIKYESLMLCKKFNELKSHEQRYLFESNNYIAEPKIDGVRCYIVYTPEEGFSCYGRSYNEIYLPMDFTDKIFIKNNNNVYMSLSDFKNFFNKSFVLDVELYYTGDYYFDAAYCLNKNEQNVTNEILKLHKDYIYYLAQETNSSFEFYILDIISFDNKEFSKYKLLTRKQIQESLINNIINKCSYLPFINVPKYTTSEEKKRSWDYIQHNSVEGLVFKNIHSEYNSTETRKKDTWIKLKKKMNLKANINYQDLDVFVIDYSISELTNLVNKLHFGIYLRKENGQSYVHKLGNMYINKELGKSFTIYEQGIPKLNKLYYNKVCSINADGICPNGTLKNISSKLVFRVDKMHLECILPQKEFL